MQGRSLARGEAAAMTKQKALQLHKLLQANIRALRDDQDELARKAFVVLTRYDQIFIERYCIIDSGKSRETEK